MADESNPVDPENDENVDPQLAALLDNEAMWEMPDLEIEDAIVAAIAAEAGITPASTNVTSITAARSWSGPLLAGVAAAVFLVVGVLFVLQTDDPASLEVALEATPAAPGATGTLQIDNTPLGTRLILDVAGLPPSEEGQYYEAWLRTGPEVGVSAGTFHLRGGDGEIELWAGVTIDDYPLFTVTVQDEADPVSSGQVVLKVIVES